MSKLTLAPLFRDHAVFQREQPVPIWGRAAPKESITVSFGKQQLSTTADSEGRWSVSLAPLNASAKPTDLTVRGHTAITVRDILVGEVWLATGQSNMNRSVSSQPEAATVLAEVDQPLIRHINIALTAADSPAEHVKTSGWLTATPEHVGDFSAVAWFFSSQLQSCIDVPVGIIHSSWGGSNIEAWMDESTLRSTSAWPDIKQRWDHLIANFDTIKHDWETWQQAEEKAQSNGSKNELPRPLIMPMGPGTQRQQSGLFNGMLAPLQPYAIRGNLWYQGEANWDRPAEYAEIFPTMIKAWRTQWGQGDFPFYFVQLPNYTDERDPTGSRWAWIRDAQTSALDLPATGMAVTIDCGNDYDIHPFNKPTVGHRLALLAAQHTYGLNLQSIGSVFNRIEIEGPTLRVHFDHAEDGLTTPEGPPRSFEVAGSDRTFHPATATIDGSTIIVRSDQVPQPVAVRYAWNNLPSANLYNQAGLPAAPFRSDDW